MITAAMIKELRESTGAGMVDCKNALTEAEGNMERASEILREKGLAAAAKKAGRIASEGLVYSILSDDTSKGVVVEVNSETDFVAKNDAFKSFVNDVAVQVMGSSAKTVEELANEQWYVDKSITVKDALTQKIAIIGENLGIRRFTKFERTESGMIVNYIHGGGRVVVMVEMLSAIANDAVLEAGKNVCMQIAAMSPQFVKRSEISEEFINKEKEILTQQALNEGKPANIVEKMIVGRLNKGLKELCLLDQEYVKDSEMTVQAYLDKVGKENGAPITLTRFVRYETGEGLAKKEENFAEEVSKAMGK